jgi:heterodisulfide reductase subunit A
MEEPKQSQMLNKVLVVGGGMAGIRAALDLAEAGRNVVLIDKAYAIGGLMTSLDRTFPTNNCDLCTLSPHLSESGRELHVELMPLTRLSDLTGQAGQFQAVLTTEPRYIDLGKCTACGECLRAFPEAVRFTPGLDHRAPTCMRYPQATPYAFSIDMERVRDVDQLSCVCPAGAILATETRKTRLLEVGSVILAPGADLFNPEVLDTYHYGSTPDVVTSLEYERILSASGPTRGELVRPSDGKIPSRIAWIQCVGSRGIQEGCVSYCSSACCMYALKEAMVTRERFGGDVETVLFYMDMRTSGKDYETYLERARNEYGVRLVRSRPHSVVFNPENNGLDIAYNVSGNGALRTESFDMVVLTTGFRASPEVQELSARLGIELNEHSFARTATFSPVSTSRPGIYVAGLFEGPKDIPETMVQASAAAACAAADLPPLRVVEQREEDFPPERDVNGEEARIGVFVCDCGSNIGGIINVDAIAQSMRSLPQVAVSVSVGHGCSRESLDRIRKLIQDEKLNRIVMGSCSPRTHETLFQDTLRRAGLNKYLLEMANLRDQDTWVHGNSPRDASAKALELMRMAISAVRWAHPLADNHLPMNKDILVVGGGVAGLSASLSLADVGYRVYLVERSGKLGGNARKVLRTLTGEDVQASLDDLISRVEEHDRIIVFKNSVVVDHSGVAGLFKTGLQVGAQMFYRQVRHGITILATGAVPNRPREYLLGRHKAVTTQLDLEAFLEKAPEAASEWKNVVMIQCVGSRVPENPNCSKVCCQAAVKNALRIRDLNPEARIFVLYRDMRTSGFEEDYYRRARERGIIFTSYEMDDKPRVEPNGATVSVTFTDTILGQAIRLDADCLALSTGFKADEESTEDLGAIFRLSRTADGYFLEDHVKLRPVDLSIPGFFVAGAAHAPKSIRESIAQAQAVAARAQTFLSRDVINLGAAVARVDGSKCAACLICVRACPFDVPFINEDGVSEIDPAKCHGCGVCASECPAKAIQLMQFEDDQIMAKIDGLLERIA